MIFREIRAHPRVYGLLAGVVADSLFGDPRRMHPVAGFGKVASKLEKSIYRDSRSIGLLHSTILIGAIVAASAELERRLRGRPLAQATVTAMAAWTALCGTSLHQEAQRILRPLERGDFAAVRAEMPHLFGDETSSIENDQLPRMIFTTVSENTVDAMVAPFFWGTVAGIPGLLGYRAINTLDGKIGMLSERYHRFGWASARIDDYANWVPARIAALATIACAPLFGGSTLNAWHILRRDADLDPSPNSGQMYGAFCGALNVTLKREQWALGECSRFQIGDGPLPQIQDAHRAVTASRTVCTICTAGLLFSLYITRRVLAKIRIP